jgi:Tfp pilus assembly protein PilO
MNTVQEYRNPLLIAGGALVVAIILYLAVIAPQGSKLSSLHAQETTLQTQQATLQAQLTTLQTEKQKLSANCADLEKITTQIPSVKTASDLAAEQSSFYGQLSSLVISSGTAIPAFAWGTTSTGGTTGSSSTGVVPVPLTMQITGNFQQMTAFVSGLDNFPRLFVIQTFTLSVGGASGTSGSGSSSTGSSSTGAATTPALWVGGTTTAGGAGPYTLALTGQIYYTSTPNATAACTAATTAAK